MQTAYFVSFFPKGTDFTQILDAALDRSLHLINHRLRKCLGWKTAHESFTEEQLVAYAGSVSIKNPT
ncbi:hypothetical protein gpAD87_19145 [Paenibacillus sp. AD87]|nr:hypothetical protein gpAD87_19145 [Paenibacillus sp. AD87]